MKLISYMYSYSGDSGLCLSNREEWNTIDEYLYFDAEKWTMEKIYDTVKTLYREYESLGHTWTLAEVMNHIRDTFVPFVNGNEGVYLSNGHGWNGTKEEKKLTQKNTKLFPGNLTVKHLITTITNDKD